MEYPYVDEENGWVWFNDEMIVINEDVEMRWSSSNKKHYISLGYECINWHELFNVNVQDLSKGSNLKVSVICPQCKNQRTSQFYNLTTYGHSKCQSCAQFIDRTGKEYDFCKILEYAGKNKQGASMWECECQCGAIFITHGYSLERGDTVSCGCHRIALSITRFTKDKNPNWNTRLTDKDREIGRNYGEMRQWSKEIKIQDNFVCQCCNKGGGKLESHHLNSYKDYPGQRHLLENGITLCRDCHTEFHSWMGGYQVKCERVHFEHFCEDFYPNAMFISN